MNKKLLIFIIIALLVITAGTAWWYLSSLKETPEHSFVVVSGGKEEVIDIDKMSLVDFTGTTVNGKGEKKEIKGQGIKLSDVFNVSDYTEASVIADDAYAAVVKKDEMDQAWLQIEEGEARLIVFGDTDSKRNVKHVVRIEIR
ncbi:MAG: hypothetical protein K6B68_04200 [Eubacterium sp.]|nr:hypothetical protein [Eubacterium sp.]